MKAAIKVLKNGKLPGIGQVTVEKSDEAEVPCTPAIALEIRMCSWKRDVFMPISEER